MNQGQFFITIPKWIANFKKLKKGQDVDWELYGKNLKLKINGGKK